MIFRLEPRRSWHATLLSSGGQYSTLGVIASPPVEQISVRCPTDGQSVWHRKAELICAPNLSTERAVTGLALLSGLWCPCARSLGLLLTYVAYSHHLPRRHHWSGGKAWLRKRKRWHSLHHPPSWPPGCNAVTTGLRELGRDDRLEKHSDSDPTACVGQTAALGGCSFAVCGDCVCVPAHRLGAPPPIACFSYRQAIRKRTVLTPCAPVLTSC